MLANCQCSMCREWYAPYSELWSDEKLCSFCKEDIEQAVERRIAPRADESAADAEGEVSP